MSEFDGDAIADSIISVYELSQIADYLNDEDVRWALMKVTKIIANPQIPSDRVAPLMLKFQALSYQFEEQGKYYMFKGKGEPEARDKKNYYLSIAKQTADLVAVLKYIAKT